MKHIIYLFFVFFTCINTSKAQVTISSRDLHGTTWKFSKSIYEYQNGKEIWHRSDGSTFTYQYYLSNTIPKSFDFSKVGQNAQGRYLIEYNPILDTFLCFSIVRFDKKEKIMSFKLETKDVIGNTGISNFTLIPKISTSDLNNTIWQSKYDYKNRSMNYYEYVNGQLTWYFDDGGDCKVYQYYLSETNPAKFDSSKVGKNTEGYYLIIYDAAKHTFSSFLIEKATELSLQLKTGTNTSVGGTFKKVTRHELNQRSKINDSKPGSNNKKLIEAIR